MAASGSRLLLNYIIPIKMFQHFSMWIKIAKITKVIKNCSDDYNLIKINHCDKILYLHDSRLSNYNKNIKITKINNWITQSNVNFYN